jgi:hypothetical protein
MSMKLLVLVRKKSFCYAISLPLFSVYFLFLNCFLCFPFGSSLPLHNTNLQLW